MSQQMNILRCISCKMYQVHIVKKAKKWQCKICNLKQSFRQIYFQGSGKECRIYVQKLNMKANENEKNASFEMDNNRDCSSYVNHSTEQQPKFNETKSKWAKYLDTSEKIQSSAFKTLNNKNYSSKEDSDFAYIHNDSKEHEYAQSHCMNNDSYENNAKEDFHYDENKDNNIVMEETLGNVSNNNNSTKNAFCGKNITETTEAKNIFDDNEDLDLVIDF